MKSASSCYTVSRLEIDMSLMVKFAKLPLAIEFI